MLKMYMMYVCVHTLFIYMDVCVCVCVYRLSLHLLILKDCAVIKPGSLTLLSMAFAPTESEVKWHSRVGLFVTPWTIYSPWSSPGQNTGVGSLSLLRGTFPTQGSNPGLQHCRRIL